MGPFYCALEFSSAVPDHAHLQGIDVARTRLILSPHQTTELSSVNFSRFTFDDCIFLKRASLDWIHLMVWGKIWGQYRGQKIGSRRTTGTSWLLWLPDR